MVKTHTKFSLAVIFTFLLTITSMGLLSYHVTSHCTIITNGTEINKCPDIIKDFCKKEAPALKIRYTTGSTENKITCSWREFTSIIGFISLILSLFLIIMFAFMACGKSFKWSLCVFVSIVIPALILTFGFMIGDINLGYTYYKSLTQGGDYLPGTYIANLALVMLLIVMFGALTLVGWKIQGINNEEDTRPIVQRVNHDNLDLKAKVRAAHANSQSSQYGYALNSTQEDLSATRILDSARVNVRSHRK